MRILLINPKISLHKIYGKFKSASGIIPPMGLLYIASVLLKDNHIVKIIDYNVINFNIEDSLNSINFTPDLIGVSVYTNAVVEADSLLRKFKGLYPHVPLVVGGPHIIETELGNLEKLNFDYAVIGEGEYTMRDLVRELGEITKNLENIKGLIFRNNGKLVCNPPREPIYNLDELPFPAWHLIPSLSIYYKPKILSYKKLPCGYILSSRGCPFNCIFCKTVFGKKVRFHSPEYVISHIKYLIKNYGVKDIIFLDDTFIISKERVLKICEYLIKENIKICWSCNVRADIADKNLLLEMKKAGCWLVFFGVESGNQTILNNLKKGTTLEEIINLRRLAKEAGLITRGSFILGNPGETVETINETIKFAKKLQLHYPMFTFMTPYPGTEMWNNSEMYGIFDKKNLSKLMIGTSVSFVPYGLDENILRKKHKEAYRKTYLNISMIWRHMKTIQSVSDVSKIIRGLLGLFS